MEISSPIQVEVSVQDFFFADAVDEEDDRSIEPSPAPVAEAEWERWFQHWLDYLSVELAPNQIYELSLRLTDDAEIQALNAQYRYKNQPTDVLAFAALESDYPSWEAISPDFPLYLGDIVISVETAQVQATERDHSLRYELAWLAAHAFLHLLGWDHPDEASLDRMLKQQEDLLHTVGLCLADQLEESTESNGLERKGVVT